MGKSDVVLTPWYKKHIKPVGDTALLGFVNNNMFEGDLYDLQLENWNINSDWSLKKKYDTIICLRCAYFCKEPKKFIKKCFDYLNPGGKLYVDWGYGDHWRNEEYKIGWLKNNEHECAYREGNFLWSGIWHDSFMNNKQFQLFCDGVKKFGYQDVKASIYAETPSLVQLEYLQKYFDVQYSIAALWQDRPQAYILIEGHKK